MAIVVHSTGLTSAAFQSLGRQRIGSARGFLIEWTRTPNGRPSSGRDIRGAPGSRMSRSRIQERGGERRNFAMKKRSAGILMYKRSGSDLLLLLVHPGGPFWARKDLGAWSIPKGEYQEGADPFSVAKREFEEELGAEPSGEFLELGELVQPSRTAIVAWALEGDFAVGKVKSNTFELEWPPKSGNKQHFPEVDRAEWFLPSEARRRILPGQRAFIDRLIARIGFVEPRQ